MLMVRGIDHFVMPVRDLDKAIALYQSLGFIVTPRAEHPWGTGNALVQLDGAFLELLTVVDESKIREATDTFFSFGAFNRDFLKKHEGTSMLVLESQSSDVDRQSFEKLGLPVFDAFPFERIAKGADGQEKTVGFTLTFTQDHLSGDAGFFTCKQHYPENFWNPDYQRHDNSAVSVLGILMTAEEPAYHHEFLSGFSGQREMKATSFGIHLETPRGAIGVVTPKALEMIYGATCHPDTGAGVFCQAIRIGVRDMATFRSIVNKSELVAHEHGDHLVLSSDQLFGTNLIIEQI